MDSVTPGVTADAPPRMAPQLDSVTLNTNTLSHNSLVAMYISS